MGKSKICICIICSLLCLLCLGHLTCCNVSKDAEVIYVQQNERQEHTEKEVDIYHEETSHTSESTTYGISPYKTYEAEEITWVLPNKITIFEDVIVSIVMPDGELRDFNVIFYPEMFEGALDIQIVNLYKEGNQWRMTLKIFKVPGYATQLYYHYFLDETLNQWIWDDPHWPMPEGMSEMAFLDYILDYPETLWLPHNSYYSKEGLHEIDTIYSLIFMTAIHIYKPQVEDYSYKDSKYKKDYFVSYDQVNQMAIYLYGDRFFDIRKYIEDLQEPWMHEKADEGFIVVNRWCPYDIIFGSYVLDIDLLSDNRIEVITVNRYFDVDYYNYDYDDRGTNYDYDIFLRRIYQVVVIDDTTFFTLLLLEEIEPSQELTEKVLLLREW